MQEQPTNFRHAHMLCNNKRSKVSPSPSPSPNLGLGEPVVDRS
ncbi:hypothetical protein [Glaciibacter sp. 2TAF33]